MATEAFFSFFSCFLFLLFFSFHACFATAQSTVQYLPGFNGPLPFHLQTGYVGVGELEQDQLFYYFIESEGNPKEDPILVWLNGGPGCSALSALVFGIGPLNFEYVEYNGSVPTLALNPLSWTKAASIIFVDSPVWTGFSYSEGSKDSYIGDIKSAKDVHDFLKKWLNVHPQFLSNPLYVAGDSYAGIIVPLVVHEIANGIDEGQQPIVNLKGYLLGNPVTDQKVDFNAVVPYLHTTGVISNELYESAKKSCDEDYFTNSRNSQCQEILDEICVSLSGLNRVAMLEPKCPFQSPNPRDMWHCRPLEEISKKILPPPPPPTFDCTTLSLPPDPLPDFGCRSYGLLLSYYYANTDSVRKALHIRKGSIGEWERCNSTIHYVKEIQSSVKYHLNLVSRGYRALIYSGDHDTVIPFLGTQAWIKSLNFSISDEWRPWLVDGKVAGYTLTYAKNLTFATVKGGGHTAPEYMPRECLSMLQRWISQNQL